MIESKQFLAINERSLHIKGCGYICLDKPGRASFTAAEKEKVKQAFADVIKMAANNKPSAIINKFFEAPSGGVAKIDF